MLADLINVYYKCKMLNKYSAIYFLSYFTDSADFPYTVNGTESNAIDINSLPINNLQPGLVSYNNHKPLPSPV